MALRVVLVDDNHLCASAVRLLLERQGARVVGVASKSAEAVHLVAGLRPDVVLIDLMLGDESGLDLAELLGHDGGDDTPPMILISAHSSAEVGELTANSTAAGFLSKSDLSVDAIRQIVAARSVAVRNS